MEGSIIESLLLETTICNLFLVSLVSADALTSKESCEHSLKVLTSIKTYLNRDNISKEIDKDRILRFVEEGIEIVNRDIKQFLN